MSVICISISIFIAIALSLAVLPAADSDTSAMAVPPGERKVYKTVDGRELALEIYRPRQATGPVPGIVLFHGGGWTNGSLSQFRYACQYFASRGMVAATVEYRMHAASSHPQDGSYKAVCITDAKSAIRWLKQHAAELGLDPARLVAGGGSAGGHIAVLATNQAGLDDPQDPPGVATSVVAYVLFNPAFSPADAATPEVDVARHVKVPVPPAVVFFGTKDDTWKPGGDAFVALARQRGGVVLYGLAEGQKHGFFNRPPWCDATLIAADRFLVQQGLLSGEPTLKPVPAAELVTAP